MKRFKMSRKGSRKNFRRGTNVKHINVKRPLSRGGIRF